MPKSREEKLNEDGRLALVMERVERIRDSLGESKTKFAARMGVSQSHYQNQTPAQGRRKRQKMA